MYALAAFLLITTPTAAPVPKTASPFLLLALKAVCIQNELMDRSDQPFFFEPEFSLADDLTAMRERYLSLKDAPHSQTLLFFPCEEVVDSALTANIDYQVWVKRQLHICNSDDDSLTQAMEEAKELYQVWAELRSIQYSRNCGVFTQRTQLQAFCKTLGYDKFYAGVLPPHLPIWRFQSVN